MPFRLKNLGTKHQISFLALRFVFVRLDYDWCVGVTALNEVLTLVL